MARRPKRSLAEELQRHEQCVVAAKTLTDALAGLHPEIPELRTASTCLDLSLRTFKAKRGEAETEAAAS